MPRQSQSGFTLVELLAVLVIMAILMTAGILSVPGLLKSTGLSTGLRQVSNTLNLARQYAVTHRATTRVVFPYSGTTGSTGTNLAPWYLSYSVMARTGTSAYVYISKWERLPAGVVLNVDSLSVDSLPFPTNSAPPCSLVYIQFGPTGESPGGTFAMGDGFVTVANTPTFTSANVGTISVNRIGRVRIERPE